MRDEGVGAFALRRRRGRAREPDCNGQRDSSTDQHRPQRIDIDQLAMVLLPLNFGNVGIRPCTQLAKPPRWPLTFTAETLPVPRITNSRLISVKPELCFRSAMRQGTRPR